MRTPTIGPPAAWGRALVAAALCSGLAGPLAPAGAQWPPVRQQFEVQQDGVYARGYRDGFARGMRDGQERRRYDPTGSREYQEGGSGYTESDGSRQAYRDNYRAGYRQGYEDGYRRGAGRR